MFFLQYTLQNQDPWKFHIIAFVKHPWKFHVFFNCPWKFHMLFLQYILQFHVLNLPLWIFSGMGYFLKKPLEFSDLSLYSQKIQRKQSYNHGNFAKLYGTPSKFQGQKTRPMEFPHVLSSIPLEIPCPQPPLFGYFWNKPILLLQKKFVIYLWLGYSHPQGGTLYASPIITSIIQ